MRNRTPRALVDRSTAVVRAHDLRLVLVAAMFLCGSLLALQARINGLLGTRLGSSVAASAISFVIGLLTLAICVVPWQRRRAGIRRLLAKPPPWYYWLGGLGGALSVSAIIVGTPRLGVTLVSVTIGAGMVSGALAADLAGVGPGGRHPLSGPRLVGTALAIAAVVVGAAGRFGGHAHPLLLLFVAAGGFATALQQGVNGRLARAASDPLVAALVSFGVGSVVLLLLLNVGTRHLQWPSAWWLYTGGVIAVVYVTAAAKLVAQLGVLVVMIASVAGQLAGSIVVDLVAPVRGANLSSQAILGAVLAMAAVTIAGRARGTAAPAPDLSPESGSPTQLS